MSNTTVPQAPEELAEALNDPKVVGKLVTDGQLAEFVKSYASAVLASDDAIQAQLKEEVQAGVAEFLKADRKVTDRLNLTPGEGAVSNPKNALYNKKAPGAALDKEFDSPADFFQSIWHHSNTMHNAQELAARADKVRKVQNSFGSLVPADGGFLIPETLRSEILQVALESSVVRSRARVIPMESLRVPIPSIDSTSNASSVFGGIVCYWTEEGAALTESQATFGRVLLDAKKLTGYAEMPNELVADATAFGSFFGSVFPEALAWFEDVAFIEGTGVGEPLGWLNHTSTASVAKESGQAANSIVWENITKMYARMLPSSLSRACWIANLDTFPELATMALSVGTGGSAVWLNNGAVGPPMTILGRPVIFTEKVPSLGTTGDISFVDLGYYLIGDRQVMQATSSPHYKFANDKTAFRIIERVDGRPWLQSAITPRKGAGTLSPFVQLATRP